MRLIDFIKLVENKYFIKQSDNDTELDEEFEDIELPSNKKTRRFYLSDKNITLSKRKVRKFRMDISSMKEQYKKLNEDLNLINEVIQEDERQKLLKEVINLTKEKESLRKSKKKLSEEVSKLSFQKEMLEVEINELELKKKENIISTINAPTSLEYIDSLTNGLDFEKYFALILEQLGYINITVTSGSGDYGIDVLATKDDIKYGFQCKLYSSTVGNDAVQQAYSGKGHYNCNVVIVVTNNYFSNQAKKQALETQVILWDRNVLSKKIKEINKDI